MRSGAVGRAAANAACAAGADSGLPGQLPAYAIRDWVARARESIGYLEGPKVCEVGFTDQRVAQSFLCQFARAQYVGVGFLPNSSEPHRPLKATLGSQVQTLVGDTSRSVVQLPTVADCNVLVVNMGDRAARERRSLLVDLPNSLRRTSLNRSMVILHGYDCPPGRVRNASQDCRARFPRNCATRGDWCSHWQQLDDGGVLVGSSCASDKDADWRWCVGRVDSGSICTTRAPLLKATTRTVVRLGRRNASEKLGKEKIHEVRRKGLLQAVRQGVRYLSVFSCEDRPTAGSTAGTPRLCLTFKDNVQENFVAGMQSTDGGYSFAGSAVGSADLVMPGIWAAGGPRAKMAHNLVVLQLPNGSYVAIGGQHKHKSQPENLGVWLTRGRSWRFSQERVIPAYFTADKKAKPTLRQTVNDAVAQWERPRKIFDGNHAGCVERRDIVKMPWILAGVCEYDGRLSLVWFQGEYLLYARANPAAHGQRYVQLARSTDTWTWSPFELVQIRDYRYSQGDMYFFAAQVNPVQPDSLVAIFPLVHLMRACIGIAFSPDGLRWSTITPLVGCDAYGDRAVSHPAAGLIRSGDQVLIFVHEEVPNVRLDLFTPFILQQHWKRSAPPAKVVRYAISVSRLRRWTALRLAEFGAAKGLQPRKMARRMMREERSNRTRDQQQQMQHLKTENARVLDENGRLKAQNERLAGELARLKAQTQSRNSVDFS